MILEIPVPSTLCKMSEHFPIVAIQRHLNILMFSNFVNSVLTGEIEKPYCKHRISQRIGLHLLVFRSSWFFVQPLHFLAARNYTADALNSPVSGHTKFRAINCKEVFQNKLVKEPIFREWHLKLTPSSSLGQFNCDLRDLRDINFRVYLIRFHTLAIINMMRKDFKFMIF